MQKATYINTKDRFGRSIKLYDIEATFSIQPPEILRFDYNPDYYDFYKILESELYAIAEVEIRVSNSENRQIYIANQEENFKDARNFKLIVGVPGFETMSQKMALKALEVLAYGFNDYKTRESICGHIKFSVRAATTHIPKGVYRYKTHEEADAHEQACIEAAERKNSES